MKTKTIPAGEFKVHCLAVMDEVQAKRQAVLITKRGKPVAKLVPVEKEKTISSASSRAKAKSKSRATSSPRIHSRRMGRPLLILLDTHVVIWLAAGLSADVDQGARCD